MRKDFASIMHGIDGTYRSTDIKHFLMGLPSYSHFPKSEFKWKGLFLENVEKAQTHFLSR